MRKFALILIGIVLIAACVGYVGWRIHDDPNLLERYERSFSGAVENQSDGSVDAGPDTNNEDGAARAARSAEQKAPRNALKLFEIVLDFANVIVGLIGIWLAVSGMRMRARANDA